MAKFIVSKDRVGQWRFKLVADNGKVVAVSESYKQKQSALNGINCIARVSEYAEIVFE